MVLRIATDHPEAVADARTESVAAPAARAAGVLVPRLIAFDDSRTLIDRPYSIWERIHGETVGLLPAELRLVPGLWAEVGRQLALLHTRIHDCPDPNGWLDVPARTLDLPAPGEIQKWLNVLKPILDIPVGPAFLHNDVHPMNVMSTRDGSLLALIDWGDAGWGDPALDFAYVPLPVLSPALAAYEEVAPGRLGEKPEARILWDHIAYALEVLPADPLPLDELRSFLANWPLFRRFDFGL